LNYELFRVCAALAGTILAAHEDAKTSFIDDRLTFAMIVLGSVLSALSFDWGFIAFSIGGTAFIFAVGYLLYRTGQLGGGDVLLFCGIHALLPQYPSMLMRPIFALFGATPPVPVEMPSMLLVPFIVSVYVASSAIGIAGSGMVYFWKLRARTGFRRLRPDVLGGTVALCTSALLLGLAFSAGLSLSRMLLSLLFLAPAVFLIAFKRDISEKVSLRWLTVGGMEDEDIIDLSKMPRAIVEKYGVGPVLTDKMKKVLLEIERKEGMRRFPVQKDLPRFGPYILLGLLAALYFGDPLTAFLLR
jgi:hypothetical protein